MKRLFSFVFAVLMMVPLCVAAAAGPQLEATEKPLCTIDFSAWEAKKYAHDPDLRHFAYATGDGTKEWIVIDGKEQPPYDRVTTPVFSAGGARVAYGAKRGEKCLRSTHTPGYGPFSTYVSTIRRTASNTGIVG